MKKNNGKWYGFTEDKVFGWVMADEKFCKFVLQTVLPEITIKKINYLQTQKELNNVDRDSRDVRLDLLVKDEQGRIFDIEVQVANRHNLGKRMRFYQSQLDSHYTLEKGATYNDLKESYVIFLCDFDFFGRKKIRYSFQEYEDSDRTLKLPTAAHKIIINSKGRMGQATKNLIDLTRLMRGELIKNNSNFDYVQSTIREINEDPERRLQIMDFETKLLEREQEGKAQEAEINLKKSLKRYLSLGLQKDQILSILLEDYGDEIDHDEIKSLVDRAV
jgi:predicted transposase/invertase (TIGR01784 family)